MTTSVRWMSTIDWSLGQPVINSEISEQPIKVSRSLTLTKVAVFFVDYQHLEDPQSLKLIFKPLGSTADRLVEPEE
jgi:hypothetical protein